MLASQDLRQHTKLGRFPHATAPQKCGEEPSEACGERHKATDQKRGHEGSVGQDGSIGKRSVAGARQAALLSLDVSRDANNEPEEPSASHGTTNAREDVIQETPNPLDRPLPRVGIPLLADERRAVRTRKVAVLSVIGAALVAFAGWQFLNSEPSSDENGDDSADQQDSSVEDTEEAADDQDDVDERLDEDPGWPAPLAELKEKTEPAELDPSENDTETAEADPPEPTAETTEETPQMRGAISRVRAEFGEARGFRPALLAAGLAGAEAVTIEGLIGELLDFRRCNPTDTLVIERDGADRLVRFEYHDEPTSFVRVDAAGENYIASREEIPTSTTHIVRAGVVQSSLGNAVAGVGLGRNIVGLFIEVFAGQVNFSTQAQAGDTFRIVLEEVRMNGEFLRFGQVLALEYNGERAGALKAYFFQARGERRGDWYGADARAVQGGWLRTPTRYDRISSPFDPRRMHPVLRRIVPHNGTDFAASTGTPVWAAADGVVTWAGDKGPNGNLVSIRHSNGYSTHYAHLHQIQRGIRVGVEVEQRQLIGTVGTTGRSTGPHLHFGLKRNGRHLDAMLVINGPGQLLPAGQRGAFRRVMLALDEELATVPLPRPPASNPPAQPETPENDPATEAAD